jgi:hypothetical protein
MKQYTLVVSLSIVPLTVLVSVIIEDVNTGRINAGWHGKGNTKA